MVQYKDMTRSYMAWLYELFITLLYRNIKQDTYKKQVKHI